MKGFSPETRLPTIPSRSVSRRKFAARTAEAKASSDASTRRAIRSIYPEGGTGTSISPRLLADSDFIVALTTNRLVISARPNVDVKKYHSQWPIPIAGFRGRTTNKVTPATVRETCGGTRAACTAPARAVTNTSKGRRRCRSERWLQTTPTSLSSSSESHPSSLMSPLSATRINHSPRLVPAPCPTRARPCETSAISPTVAIIPTYQEYQKNATLASVGLQHPNDYNVSMIPFDSSEIDHWADLPDAHHRFPRTHTAASVSDRIQSFSDRFPKW